MVLEALERREQAPTPCQVELPGFRIFPRPQPVRYFWRMIEARVVM